MAKSFDANNRPSGPSINRSGNGAPPPLPANRKGTKGPIKIEVRERRSSDQSNILRWSIVGGTAALLIVLIGILIVQFGSKRSNVPTAGDPPDSTRVPSADANSEPMFPGMTIDSDHLTPPVFLPTLPQKSAEGDMTESTPPEAPITDEVAVAEIEKPVVPEPEPEPEPVNVPADPGPDPTATPSSSDYDERIQMAARQIRALQGKDAITTLKRASGNYPKEIRADFYLGLVHSGVGLNEPKIAEEHFRKVLDRSPGHIPTLNNLALVQLKGRKVAAARNSLTIAAKADSHPRELDQNIGRMLYQARTLDIKPDELKKISSLNINAAIHHNKTGWLYMPLDTTPASLIECKSFCKGGNLEDRSCNVCGGKSSLACRTCAGRRTVLATGSTSDVKNIGVGERVMITTTAPTSAQVPCPTCHGSGRIDCDACRNGHDPSLPERGH